LNQKIAALQAEIADRQKTLRDLIEQERKKQKPITANHRKRFDPETLRRHKAQRSPLIPYMINLPWQVHLSSPFVYGMIVPIVILDISLVVYQATCFRLWGVERARRRDFVIVDRHYLAYLNGIEKLNCVYCGYANGVFAFARELAARTEKFWCPIKHAIRLRQQHSYYNDFIEFGDADGWRKHPARKKPTRE